MPHFTSAAALLATTVAVTGALAASTAYDPGCGDTDAAKAPARAADPASARCGASAPAWTEKYFEPSLILSRAQITPEDVAFEANASGLGLPCGTKLTGSRHVVGCSGVPGGGWTLEPAETANATVLYLPGWSSDLERPENRPTGSFVPFFAQLIAAAAPALDRVRFVTPIPPFRKLTAVPDDNSSDSPRSWFDVLEVPTTSDREALLALQWDRLGLLRTAERISSVVDAEKCKHGILAERIFLYGHSFGAAAAYHVALQTDIAFAGAYASAGFLPLSGDYLKRGAKAFNAAGKGYNWTVGHGVNDTTLPVENGEAAADILEPLLAPTGSNVQFIPFPGEDHASIFSSEVYSRSLLGAILAALR